MAYENGCQCLRCRILPLEKGHLSDCAVHGHDDMDTDESTICTCPAAVPEELKKEKK